MTKAYGLTSNRQIVYLGMVTDIQNLDEVHPLISKAESVMESDGIIMVLGDTDLYRFIDQSKDCLNKEVQY